MSAEQLTTRLRNIQEEIRQLAGEALGIVQEIGSTKDLARASSYWYIHIMGALFNKDGRGKSMVTMDDTIAETRQSLFERTKP